MSILIPAIRKLYGLAGAKCSICREVVFRNNSHIGEMAHIVAKSKKGARGNEFFSGDINSYENLILLCANHHLEVDQNPAFYTVDVLLGIKSKHEKYIAQNPIEKYYDKGRLNDVLVLKEFIECTPFSSILSCINLLPYSVDMSLCNVEDAYCHLLDNPTFYPFNDNELNNLFEKFMNGYNGIWRIIRSLVGFGDYPQAVFSASESGLCLSLQCKFLPHEQLELIIEELCSSSINFKISYKNLVAFIRSNYKEINLN